MPQKYKKIIFTIIGLLIFSGLIFINRKISLDSFANINYFYLLLALIFDYIGITLAAYRWGWIINALENKKKVPYRKYFFYFSLSSLISLFGFQELSAFGTQTGILLTEKINFKKIINIYLIDKFFNTINLILVAIFSVLYFIGLINLRPSIVLIALSLIVFYFIVSHPKINFTALMSCLNKIFTKLIKIVPFLKIKISEETADENLILPPKIIKKIYLLSWVKFIFLAISVFFIFKSLNLNIDVIKVLLAFSISQLTLVFSITPGGLGFLETGWFAVLKIIGFTPMDINTFLIGYRIISYIIIAIIAFINYLLFLTVKNKNL